MKMELLTLYSDHKATQEQLADVNNRVATAKESLKTELAKIEAEWKASNSELLHEQETIERIADITESELRIGIVEAYKADPTKKTVAPGLSVRVTKKPVYDTEKAFNWALDHKLALKLDNKAFEKIADSATDIDFITYDESVTAVISK